MNQLSPKKYIETKVRSLPVYKCLVNKDWQEAGMANVIVMRRHVNGNVSGGVYLVDLKCLGVKDSMWFFNESEKDMMEKFSGRLPLETIDYTLAHNIVYTGHDFAMEFDIHPVKEFATSRFVLEEDTDDIPLIDIETGDNGMPHLIVYEAGQYTDALARLRKHAGEGNYHYTLLAGKSGGFDDEDDFEEEVDEEDFDEDENEDAEIPELRLSEIEVGALDLINIREIHIDDLLDENKVSSRNEMEQLLCRAELIVRTFSLISPNDEADETSFIEDEWDMFPDPGIYDTGMNEDSYKTAMDQIADTSGELINLESKSPEPEAIKEKYLQLNKDNPLFICLLFEYELLGRHENTYTLLQQFIQPFRSTPLVQLLLALESIINNDSAGEWQQIIKARYAADAIPQLQVWGETELFYFWAIQIVRHVQEGKLSQAVDYYDLFTAVDDALLHLPLVLVIHDILLPPLEQAVITSVNTIKSDEQEEDNN